MGKAPQSDMLVVRVVLTTLPGGCVLLTPAVGAWGNYRKIVAASRGAQTARASRRVS